MIQRLRLRWISGLLRLLPSRLKGKSRLARTLLGRALDGRDLELKDRYGSRILVPGVIDPVGFYLLIDAGYEQREVDFVLRCLEPGSTFVDIGANVGTFVFPAARKVGMDGRVIAVEASPRIFPYLQRSVDLNRATNVILRRCAASDVAGPVQFFEPPLEKFAMGALAQQFHTNPVEVDALPLDQILEEEGIDRVDVLKVDVEGFERAVFKGAQGLLQRADCPLILVRVLRLGGSPCVCRSPGGGAGFPG